MNLNNSDKCYLTFPTDKKTAHTITMLAHMQEMNQGELLDQICRQYIAESFIEMLNRIPEDQREKILQDK